MIKAYLVGIESLYEGEDIEIRYSICSGDTVIEREILYMDYEKPNLVSLIGINHLIFKLKEYGDKNIQIVINDRSTYNTINNISKPKDKKVLKLSELIRDELKDNSNIGIEDVSQDHNLILDWDNKLTFRK